MSGCEFHVGQFDRTCCSGRGVQREDLSGWIKLEGGTLDWGDNSPCAHTDDPCTKCGKELLPGFKEELSYGCSSLVCLVCGANGAYCDDIDACVSTLRARYLGSPEWEMWDWL